MAVSHGKKYKNIKPIVIIIDRSKSTMYIMGMIIKQLKNYLTKIKSGENMDKLCRVLIITYNHDVDVMLNFTPLKDIDIDAIEIPTSYGTTNTGLAVLTAYKLLDTAREKWRSSGYSIEKPIVYLLTDGHVDAGKRADKSVQLKMERLYDMACRVVKSRENAENPLSEVVFLAAGIQRADGGADMDKLRQLVSKEHSERIICVSDEEDNVHGVTKFFQVMHKTTLFDSMSIDVLVDELFDL